MLRYVLSALVALALLQKAPYDLVIQGGRVMDPLSGLHAVRHIGISGVTIAEVSSEPLNGARRIDASGLGVAPGFIDLHSHGQDDQKYRLKAMDGVTTALELEIGVPDVKKFLAQRRGKALIHFGSSASHPFARVKA